MPALQVFLRLIKRTLLYTLIVFQPISAAALTIEDITFQENVSIDNRQIPIRGAALLRWLKIFKVYVAGFLSLCQRQRQRERPIFKEKG